MDTPLVNTAQDLQGYLTALTTNNTTVLYVDLEGNNLGRSGTLSIIQIHEAMRGTTELIDVTTLGEKAFSTQGNDGETLKQILESDRITKVFFDIRTDSDALFSLYGISVAGIQDLQLMECASRRGKKERVRGLARCIEEHAKLTLEERQRWQQVKNRGKQLFLSPHGQGFAVFDQRPLTDEIKEYCVQDVALMPTLRNYYLANIVGHWPELIQEATKARIDLSQSPEFANRGPHMTFAPEGWNSLDVEGYPYGSRVWLDMPDGTTQLSVPYPSHITPSSPPE